MIVGDEVDERGFGPVRHEGDTVDGWFPESVAAGYDAPCGANAPEVVEPAAKVLIDLAGGGPVLEFAVGARPDRRSTGCAWCHGRGD
jgi:hypothetical protein